MCLSFISRFLPSGCISNFILRQTHHTIKGVRRNMTNCGAFYAEARLLKVLTVLPPHGNWKKTFQWM
jgi:hypothetical protein